MIVLVLILADKDWEKLLLSLETSKLFEVLKFISLDILLACTEIEKVCEVWFNKTDPKFISFWLTLIDLVEVVISSLELSLPLH